MAFVVALSKYNCIELMFKLAMALHLLIKNNTIHLCWYMPQLYTTKMMSRLNSDFQKQLPLGKTLKGKLWTRHKRLSNNGISHRSFKVKLNIWACKQWRELIGQALYGWLVDEYFFFLYKCRSVCLCTHSNTIIFKSVILHTTQVSLAVSLHS